MRRWLVSKKDDLDVAIRWLAVIVLASMAAETVLFQFRRAAKVLVLIIQGAAHSL